MDDRVRVHSENGTNFQKSTEIPVLHVKAESEGESTFRDELLIARNVNAPEQYDPTFDACKFPGNADAPQIYIINEKQLSLYSVPTLTNETRFVIGFECNTPGEYKLSFEGLTDFSPEYPVYIEDKITGTVVKPKESSDYSFMHSPENEKDRFVMFFKESNGIAENRKAPEYNIHINNSMISLNFQRQVTAEINITGIPGQRLFREKVNGQKINLKPNLTPAVYILTIVTERWTDSRKIVLK